MQTQYMCVIGSLSVEESDVRIAAPRQVDVQTDRPQVKPVLVTPFRVRGNQEVEANNEVQQAVLQFRWGQTLKR